MLSRKSGFTLVEVMLASVIGAFIALVAVGALRVISASAEMVEGNIDTAAEVRFASKRIATDLMNLHRDRRAKNTRFVGTVEETEQGLISCLTFYTVGRIKARASQPEADVYEVEYYLVKDGQRRALMRRLWPNPDKDTEEAGGVLTAIAEDIDLFDVRFFDGQGWQDEWPEELESFPELVEVSIAAKPSGQKDVITESFVVNFVRSAGGEISAVEDSEEEAEEADEGEEEAETERIEEGERSQIREL